SPSSTTPPIEICSSRLTKLMRRTTDKKSEFLKALKDDRNGEITESRECDKLDDRRRNGFGKNGFLQGRSSSLFHWRSTFKTKIEDSETETSSSETSDDDA
ncbi:hypothetical protein CIB84_011037, partial [Bambusicola thoracicus]